MEISVSKFNEADINSNYFLTFMILDKSLEIDCLVRGQKILKGNYQLGLEFINLNQAAKEILKSLVGMFTTEKDEQS